MSIFLNRKEFWDWSIISFQEKIITPEKNEKREREREIKGKLRGWTEENDIKNTGVKKKKSDIINNNFIVTCSFWDILKIILQSEENSKILWREYFYRI